MNKMTRIRAEKIDWLLDGRYPDLKDDLAKAALDSGSDAAKVSRVREVLFMPARGNRPPLVLKTYKAVNMGARIRSLLSGTPASRERCALEALRSAGVRAPEVLGAGKEAALLPVHSYLATRVIEGGANLEEILLGLKPPPAPRKALAEDVARLIRKMHDAGVLHRDLHAANILVGGDGLPWILDLHSARVLRRLSIRKRFRDLVSFAGAFLIHGSAADRLRFFRAYGSGLEEPVDFKRAARALERASWERLNDFLRRYDRRALRPGRLVRTLRIHQLNGLAERSDRSTALAHFLGPFPSEVLEEKARLIHRGTDTRVYALELDGRTYVVKLYLKPGLSQEMKRIFEGSRARRSWFNYHRLQFRELPVPRPVLYLEEALPSPGGRSFLAVEGAMDHLSLDRFLKKASPAERRSVLLSLAATIARLHRFFLRNRDLKAQNILIGPSLQVLLIDPDGVEYMKDPSVYFMARDLMRLNASFPAGGPVSRSERLRFLKTYMLHRRIPSSLLRDLWRETLLLTWEKWGGWTGKPFQFRRRAKT